MDERLRRVGHVFAVFGIILVEFISDPLWQVELVSHRNTVD